MHRIGMNLARSKHSKYKPGRVTVAVLVDIPHLTGFYEHCLGVFRACIESIRKISGIDLSRKTWSFPQGAGAGSQFGSTRKRSGQATA